MQCEAKLKEQITTDINEVQYRHREADQNNNTKQGYTKNESDNDKKDILCYDMRYWDHDSNKHGPRGGQHKQKRENPKSSSDGAMSI
jgi:hypothetical protein